MPAAGNVVWLDVLASFRGAATSLAKSVAGAGTRAGKTLGDELEQSAGEAGRRAGDAVASGLEAARARVEKAADAVKAARDREAKAAGDVRVAEARLEEARDKGKASQVVAAEERLATARRNLTTATSRSIKSASDLERSEHDAAQAVSESAHAADDVAGATSRAERGTSRFGAGLLSAGKLAAGFAVSLVAVGGAADALQNTFASIDARASLQAALGTTPEVAAQYGRIAGELYAANYGDSVKTVTDAITAVMRSGALPEDATSDAIRAITGEALNLAKVFNTDLDKSMRSVATLIRNGLAPDAASALDLITRGFQQGGNVADDLLDTINEYSVQFRKLGITGAQAIGLLVQGLKAGARDGDKVADSFKEFSIRAVDGTKLTADGFTALGLNAAKMAAQIGRGGADAAAGIQTVLDRLRAMKDPVLQSQTAVALFGTQAEDLGAALYALDPSKAAAALGDVAGAAQHMGDVLASTPSAALASFGREIQIWLVDVLGGKVVPFINTAAVWLRDHFGPAVQIGAQALADFGGWLQRNASWLTPLVIGLGTFAAVYKTVTIITALWAAKTAILTAAQWALNIALNANPVGLIIGLIAGLVAAFVWLWNNNQGFRDFFIDAWARIRAAVSVAWEGYLKPAFGAVVTAVRAVGDVAVWLWQNAFVPAWSAISSAAVTAWGFLSAVFDAVSTAVKYVGVAVFTLFVLPYVLAFKVVRAAVLWAWENGIKPTLEALGDFFSWVYTTKIEPWVNIVKAAFGIVANAAIWLWQNGIKPAFDGIAFAVGVVIDAVVWYVNLWVGAFQLLWTAGQTALSAIGDFFTWLWETKISPFLSWAVGRLEFLGLCFQVLWTAYVRPALQSIGDFLQSVWDNTIGKIFGYIRDGASSVGGAFDSAVGWIERTWGKLREILAKPVNFVIQTVYNDGLRAVWNKVADFVGINGLPAMGPIAFAGGGVVSGYAPGRDVVPALLSPGEAVLVPEAVRLLGARNVLALNAALSGRPGNVVGGGYSGGGIVHRFAGGGVIGTIASWVGDFGQSVMDLFTDPAGFVRSRLGGGGGWVEQLALLPGKVIGKATDFLWSKIKGWFGGDTPAGGDQLAQWITAGMRIAGVPGTWFNPLHTLIMRESGGNPNAINLWDINAQQGHPSQGLMQTIPGTFAAYRDPRLPDVITDPVANIVAGIRYILARYGSIFSVQQAVGSTPMGYDSGGYLMPGVSTVYNGTGRPEPVLTSDQWQSLQGNTSGDSGEPVRIVGSLSVADDGLSVFVDGRITSANHATGSALSRRSRL